MTDLNELYQEVILDHNRQPCNFHRLEGPHRSAEGFNPVCGDRMTVYLRLEEGRIAEVSFLGSGCAISKASASMMTTCLKGKSQAESEALFEKFHCMVTGGKVDLAGLGKLAAFSGVSEFPMRVKCASLPWHTLRAALEARKEAVTTE